MGLSLKVLSLNLHKGFSALNARYVLPQIREKIRENGADIVFLQEALGHHEALGRHHEPQVTQYEYLADGVWSEFAYGKNAVTATSHHGNAMLSRFPIVEWKNVDISNHKLEQRGVLMCRVRDPKSGQEIVAACTHLDLFARGRKQQFPRIQAALEKFTPAGVPLVLCGDFNDWTAQAGERLAAPMHMTEAFEATTGALARTFPARWPYLRLDRIYVRGFAVQQAACLKDDMWRRLSDHLPVTAELRHQAQGLSPDAL